MVKVVFFDLGNVLVNVNRPAIVAGIAEKFHIPEALVLQPAVLEIEKQFEKGQLTIEEHLAVVKRLYKFDGEISIADLEQIWQIPFELNPEIWQIVQKLKQQVSLFLLSNTNELHIRAIRQKYDILDNLDGLILSYKVGALKPEPKIYEYALRKAGVAAGQALFVDDLPENVAGAERVGIRAHRFTGAAGLQEFLGVYGFKV
ncbi:MAG: HAD family phosphatase [Candidatus Neomarinimicrobiota bacterium]